MDQQGEKEKANKKRKAKDRTEELIFNTSSEHQTVNLSNKCMTKDFLRDFRHGCTMHGGQEDRTFDM
jgi:hypothetical protein